MQTIFLTGSTGFVGSNLRNYLSDQFAFQTYARGEKPLIKADVVVHLAGKAHDTKNVADSQEYYQINTDLTREIYDAFLVSDARVFIFMSSVKAIADTVPDVLTEETPPNPATHYGKSKLLAEQYILAQPIPSGKRVYVLRPCMIHGPGNKGNLNLLFQVVSNGIPWPLAAFNNRRSFCSIDNLCFIIREMISREDIPSGVYQVADNETVATNDLILWMSDSLSKKCRLLKVPVPLIKWIAAVGDRLSLPLNSERLQKLTENYVVSNQKLLKAIGKPLPFSAREGLIKTFQSFKR
ncbi:MAG: NAD-dependent epimerase/dehydratase family protein [Chitinophagaceae bacterium]|nr:NAD-dependent epimerase/dehydratase family protein [Chitinophagaceae bacterium]